MLAATVLAGGYSHSTWLVTLSGGPVVARFGGGDPAIEAAVMARAPGPVPSVLSVDPMVISFVEGTPLSSVLASAAPDLAGLGHVVGREVAGVAAVRFDRPGFFTGPSLSVGEQPPWSAQLPGFASQCAAKVPSSRLDTATLSAWVDLCAEHAPALSAVEHQACLAHGDINPKNILVSHADGSWRVDALLDWEFSYSGSPYADAANMARFGADYPPDFMPAFAAGFASGLTDLPPVDEWPYIGRVFDMFALTDLTTRPEGHEVADQAAAIIRQWTKTGVPRTL
ncbi:phosphotransferase [Actinoplanes sp. NPDC051633]|uniref:phosphotransferase family protein n=1 Tax=Actinoplanes sp. NPDC051633 TaxID=3155670 RepID=UPI00342CDBB8